MKTTRELPADIRALVVRQLGAALAARWRREHGHVDVDGGHDERVEGEGREGAAGRGGTRAAAV